MYPRIIALTEYAAYNGIIWRIVLIVYEDGNDDLFHRLSLFVLNTFVMLTVLVSISTQAVNVRTTNVMAPLEVSDWSGFDLELATAKSMGVDAVSYDAVVQHIENAGLRWVPIMSFHQCGGNVGDTCNIPM